MLRPPPLGHVPNKGPLHPIKKKRLPDTGLCFTRVVSHVITSNGRWHEILIHVYITHVLKCIFNFIKIFLVFYQTLAFPRNHYSSCSDFLEKQAPHQHKAHQDLLIGKKSFFQCKDTNLEAVKHAMQDLLLSLLKPQLSGKSSSPRFSRASSNPSCAVDLVQSTSKQPKV